MVPVEKLLALLPREKLHQLALAKEVNAPNQGPLTGEAVFVCLLNTLASNGVVTQRLLEETHQRVFGRQVDHSSFGKRLTRLKPAYFQALYQHLYHRLEPLFAPKGGPSMRCYRVDATTVTFTAKLLHFGLYQRSGKRDQSPVLRHIKAVMRLDAGDLPQLLHLCREQSETNDNCALGDTLVQQAHPGELVVFDAGCNDRTRLWKLHQAGAFWLTPHGRQKWRSLQTVWVHPAWNAEPSGPPTKEKKPVSVVSGAC